MRDALFDQLLRFECSLEWSHVDAWIYLEQVDLFECNGTIDIAGANRQVRETATDYVLLISLILHNRLSQINWLLLLMNKIDIVLNTLNVHSLAAKRSCSWHVYVLRMRLIELVLALLFLNHL